MPKKAVSSVELAALVHELGFLVGGKVSQIYHQEKKELLLQLHAPGKGKQLLKIIPGKFLCLTDTKKAAPTRPTGFCMQLRKYLGNAFIKKIEQKDSERIVVMEFDARGKFSLIIELFSKGNIVLLNAEERIVGTLEWQRWKDRTVKPGEKYSFPESRTNWKTITEKEFADLVQKSEKKNIATSLATEVGLGGVYAEEICLRVSVDKNIKPTEVSKEQAALLYAGLQEVLALLEVPKGYLYENEITPFPLTDQKEKEKTKTYHEAINTINPYQTTSPYQQRIQALEKTIATQETALVSLQEKIETNTKKAEKIYESYTPVQKLLAAVKELEKTDSWKLIKEKLLSEEKIVDVNLKKKSVVIEL